MFGDLTFHTNILGESKQALLSSVWEGEVFSDLISLQNGRYCFCFCKEPPLI